MRSLSDPRRKLQLSHVKQSLATEAKLATTYMAIVKLKYTKSKLKGAPGEVAPAW
jgi:hypothetical protein